MDEAELLRLRESLDLKIEGYEHPEETTGHTHEINPYSAYNESGEDVYVRKGENIYQTFSTSDVPVSTLEKCPVCTLPAQYVCDCHFSDKMCKNGHFWYTERDGRTVKGDPHVNKK